MCRQSCRRGVGGVWVWWEVRVGWRGLVTRGLRNSEGWLFLLWLKSFECFWVRIIVLYCAVGECFMIKSNKFVGILHFWHIYCWNLRKITLITASTL